MMYAATQANSAWPSSVGIGAVSKKRWEDEGQIATLCDTRRTVTVVFLSAPLYSYLLTYLLASYPWSDSVSWCPAESYGNRDQQRPAVGQCGAGEVFTLIFTVNHHQGRRVLTARTDRNIAHSPLTSSPAAKPSVTATDRSLGSAQRSTLTSQH